MSVLRPIGNQGQIQRLYIWMARFSNVSNLLRLVVPPQLPQEMIYLNVWIYAFIFPLLLPTHNFNNREIKDAIIFLGGNFFWVPKLVTSLWLCLVSALKVMLKVFEKSYLATLNLGILEGVYEVCVSKFSAKIASFGLVFMKFTWEFQ